MVTFTTVVVITVNGDVVARTATRDALVTLGMIAFGAIVLAALGSLWLARTLTEPIDHLVTNITMMTAARDLRPALQPTGSSRELDVLRLGALLHDIGKIGLSDAVLRKPGPLTPEEFEQIKRHPALGARILRQVPFLAAHLPIVELHHERPDGRGYPFGLRGDDIPLVEALPSSTDAPEPALQELLGRQLA